MAKAALDGHSSRYVNEWIRQFEQLMTHNSHLKKADWSNWSGLAMAFLTATILVRKGYKVRIFQRGENIPSHKAAGFFFPRPRKSSTPQEAHLFESYGMEILCSLSADHSRSSSIYYKWTQITTSLFLAVTSIQDLTHILPTASWLRQRKLLLILTTAKDRSNRDINGLHNSFNHYARIQRNIDKLGIAIIRARNQ